MNRRKKTRSPKPEIHITPIYDENMGVHNPIAIHAFWVIWGEEDPTEVISIDQDGEAVVLHLARMMSSVCGRRRPDFESSLAVLIAAGDKTKMGDFFKLWDEFILRRGMDVVHAHRAGCRVLQEYSSAAQLSPILVDLIADLNRRGIFNNNPEHATFRGPKVSMAMEQVDILLRRENPDLFPEEPL